MGKTLSEHASKQLLAGYGVPLAREALAADAEEAARAAGELGGPVVLKLCGDAIAHKTERNLVRLGLRGADAVREAGAELLAAGKILGWFQGRMESGPRALGNRSILMSPTKPENKDIINASVKYREGFRPFCPSILYEKGHEYLQDLRDEFFMITSFDFQPEHRETMPAVVHVDGTGRPQLVSKEMNPRYWELIKHFGDQTGCYAVLNTSMNIRGEPMVCSPTDALNMFFGSDLQYLIMEDLLVTK